MVAVAPPVRVGDGGGRIVSVEVGVEPSPEMEKLPLIFPPPLWASAIEPMARARIPETRRMGVPLSAILSSTPLPLRIFAP